jgi:hypothetical protein
MVRLVGKLIRDGERAILNRRLEECYRNKTFFERLEGVFKIFGA